MHVRSAPSLLGSDGTASAQCPVLIPAMHETLRVPFPAGESSPLLRHVGETDSLTACQKWCSMSSAEVVSARLVPWQLKLPEITSRHDGSNGDADAAMRVAAIDTCVAAVWIPGNSSHAAFRRRCYLSMWHGAQHDAFIGTNGTIVTKHEHAIFTLRFDFSRAVALVKHGRRA